MKRINKSVVLVILSAFLSISISRADILDDEEEPVVKPKPVVEPVKPKVVDVTPKPVDPKQGPVTQKKPPAKKPDDKKPANTGGKSPKSTRADGKASENLPVQFESKGLRGLREQGSIELIEDVIVTQGDLRVEADRAQISYDGDQREVMKVEAKGNVKIFNIDQSTGEKMRAFCDEVVFLNSQQTVVMEGNARLWRGTQSVIRGKKITYEIQTGWIKADRVEGELKPEEKKK